jgi:hypothetical protein
VVWVVENPCRDVIFSQQLEKRGEKEVKRSAARSFLGTEKEKIAERCQKIPQATGFLRSLIGNRAAQ